MVADNAKRTQRKRKAVSSSSQTPTAKIDLNKENPDAAPHFSLYRVQNAEYADGKWVMKPGSEMQFLLEVEEPEHLVIALELYSPVDEWAANALQLLKASKTPWYVYNTNVPNSYNPLMFTIGDAESYDPIYLDEVYNPLAPDFNTQRIILPPAYLVTGQNFFTLWLSDDARTVPLYLRSISLSAFSLQRQKQSEWCWAAVTSSLLEFMDPERAATQVQIVKRTLEGKATESSENLNQPEDITKAAHTVGFCETTRYGNVSRDTMRWMVNEGTPVPIQVNWYKNARKSDELGSGHYVVVNGIGEEAKDETLVEVADPLLGKNFELTWSDLKKNYPGDANQHLFRHKNQEQCSNWRDQDCHCKWRGKWTYTHVFVPRDWSDDAPPDKQFADLMKHADVRMIDMAGEDVLDILEKVINEEPNLDDVAEMMGRLNYSVVKLHHQLKDLDNAFAQIDDLYQYLQRQSKRKD